jgi:hypothetical protein
VCWVIDEDADNPLEAARMAWEHMRTPDSIANYFTVIETSTGYTTDVDLSDYAETGDAD